MSRRSSVKKLQPLECAEPCTCGAQAILSVEKVESNYFTVFCDNVECQKQIEWYESVQEAIAAWNIAMTEQSFCE